MKTPLPELMEHYGTDDYYVDRKEKLAALPTALRVLAGGTFLGAMVAARRKDEELRQEAASMNEMLRQQEAQRMSATVQAYQHPGDRMMAGMERLASVADGAGRALAHSGVVKEAGLGAIAGGLGKMFKGLAAAPGRLQAARFGKKVMKGKPLVGWKGKALMGAGILGAAGTGLYGMSAAKQYMTQPSMGGRRWGTGAPLKTRVNQWGQPVF